MSLFERYVQFVTRHAVIVLVGVSLITLAIAGGMSKLRRDFDMEASLPENHPFVQIDHTIRAQFGGRNTMILAIVPRSGNVWRPEVLQIVRDITLSALKLPDIMAHNVVSLAAPSVRYVEESGGAIKVDYLMREIPQTPEALATLRWKLESDPSLQGMLVTPDQQAALVFLDFWEQAEGPDIIPRVQSLIEPFRDRPVDFYFAGEPMFTLIDQLQADSISVRIPITFLVIALMLLISFRNIQGMVLPMLTAILSTIWGLGIMGHTGIVIDSWNGSAPILVIAVAAAHAAQMLKRYTEEVVRLGDNRAAVIESTVKMGPVMIAAGLTAALGFMSLALFGVRAIANFGLSCGYGIGAAVILEMTLVPALRSLLPAPQRVPTAAGFTERMLSSLEQGILGENGRRVVAGTLAAVAVALVGVAFIRTYGPAREYMPKTSMSRRHLEAIESHFPGTVTMTILYEGEQGMAKNAKVLRHMAALQAEVERDPLVLRTSSLADVVKTLHKTFNADAPNPYRVPDDQDLVAQLMFLGDSPAFERFTNRAQSNGLVTIYLRDDDSSLVGPLIERVQAWLVANPVPEGARALVAGGVAPTFLAVNEHTTQGKLLNMLVVMAAIYVVSSIVLGSPAAGFYVVTPILIATVMIFGFLGWTGIKLDMGSSSVISMAAGVGADYAIYFLFRLREERARHSTDDAAVATALHTSGRAILFVAASIGAGFLTMAVTEFRGMQLFGLLMPLSMVFSCLASLSIMPVMVLRMRPRFVFGRAATAGPPSGVEPKVA